ELTSESVDVRRSEKAGLKVLNEGFLTVALDPELTPELISEGLVRDLIRGIQSLRKDSGFDVTDRINVKADAPDEVRSAADSLMDYLSGETLAESFKWMSISENDGSSVDVSVGDYSIRIIIEKK
ncbi:MAG: isoleucine--tRNA ligase, partial [Spirochaetaceae bacterium]|nr:isoleucine--tRNA ligase [Spirochaetaceae bacterium]